MCRMGLDCAFLSKQQTPTVSFHRSALGSRAYYSLIAVCRLLTLLMIIIGRNTWHVWRKKRKKECGGDGSFSRGNSTNQIRRNVNFPTAARFWRHVLIRTVARCLQVIPTIHEAINTFFWPAIVNVFCKSNSTGKILSFLWMRSLLCTVFWKAIHCDSYYCLGQRIFVQHH